MRNLLFGACLSAALACIAFGSAQALGPTLGPIAPRFPLSFDTIDTGSVQAYHVKLLRSTDCKNGYKRMLQWGICAPNKFAFHPKRIGHEVVL
jgi:hypothetical protein